MAKIVPINGVRYSSERISDLAKVIAPPYDVISPSEQDNLYRNSSHNIIRLEKPKERSGDNELNNKYQRAKEQYENWLTEGVLRYEDTPSIYLYEQHFSFEGNTKVREGLFCGVGLEPYSNQVVLPHEETFLKPKADRLSLMHSCQASFSPVFGLYPDKEMSVSSLFAGYKLSPPDIEFIDKQGQEHKVWVICDKKLISKLASLMQSKKIFIADGHHRYETALQYQEEMSPAAGNHDYIMMTLVNLYDPGLLVLPTHRLVKGIESFDLLKFISTLQETFLTKELPYSREEICENGLRLLEESGKKTPSFGVFAGGNKFYLLAKKEGQVTKEIKDNLDVSILQESVMEGILNIDPEKNRREKCLGYTRDCLEAIDKVNAKEYQLAFLLNPVQVEDVTSMSEAGQKMPQKSTFFYPKLITGLVINPLIGNIKDKKIRNLKPDRS